MKNFLHLTLLHLLVVNAPAEVAHQKILYPHELVGNAQYDDITEHPQCVEYVKRLDASGGGDDDKEEDSVIEDAEPPVYCITFLKRALAKNRLVKATDDLARPKRDVVVDASPKHPFLKDLPKDYYQTGKIDEQQVHASRLQVQDPDYLRRQAHEVERFVQTVQHHNRNAFLEENVHLDHQHHHQHHHAASTHQTQEWSWEVQPDADWKQHRQQHEQNPFLGHQQHQHLAPAAVHHQLQEQHHHHHHHVAVQEHVVKQVAQKRKETRVGDTVTGEYTYDDGAQLRRVYYEAGVGGFKILREEPLPHGHHQR